MLPDGLRSRFPARTVTRGRSDPAMILTAGERISARIEGLNAGADDYLVKPFDLAELSA